MAKISLRYREQVQKRLVESAELKKKMAEVCLGSILEAAELIIDTFEFGCKVMICGNGGSAADSQHMAGEFVCVLNKTFNRPPLAAIALTTNSSILTAYANDFHFGGVFERQVQALGQPNDLLIGISTSGNSKNVIKAFKMAKLLKLRTLALTGENGILSKIVDVSIHVPSSNTQYIQEALLSVEHILCEVVEEELFSYPKTKRVRL